MSNYSLLWHDYETWGVNPRLDRPLQFAAIRTDHDLNIIEEPIKLHATPPSDMLPDLEACLVTGLSPQDVLKLDHLPEVEFIRKINQHMLVPGTCSVGYNNIRFDDEVTRFSLYRNLFEPYAREWKNSNSRWDILDPLRLARALRPDGINWSVDSDKKPSMRLTDLSAANNIKHGAAHDALSDVYATIEMARLLKSKQEKLYNFAFVNRGKKYVLEQLNLANPRMLLHISGMYPAEKGNMAIAYPIARHPVNNNGIVVYDLSHNPAVLASDDIEQLHKLVFSKSGDLPKGQNRLAIKTVHVNKCPVIAPLSTLTDEAITRFGVDLKLCEDNLEELRKIPDLETKIQKILSLEQFPPVDPDLALYDGFFNNEDLDLLAKIHEQAGNIILDEYKFADPRLPELVFRFKARNYPHTLTAKEQEKWREYIRQKLANVTYKEIDIAKFDARQKKILDDLVAWEDHIKQQ